MEALQGVLSGFGFALVLVLTVINLIIYHKLFRVVYFDLGKGLVKEITAAMCLAMAEVVIGSVIISVIWNATKGVFSFLLKAFVIIVVIALILGIIGGIVSVVKNRNNKISNINSSIESENNTITDKGAKHEEIREISFEEQKAVAHKSDTPKKSVFSGFFNQIQKDNPIIRDLKILSIVIPVCSVVMFLIDGGDSKDKDPVHSETSIEEDNSTEEMIIEEEYPKNEEKSIITDLLEKDPDPLLTYDIETDIENGLLYVNENGKIVDSNGTEIDEYSCYIITDKGYLANGAWLMDKYRVSKERQLVLSNSIKEENIIEIGQFLGKTGIYLSTDPYEGSWTGMVEILEITKNSVSFNLGILDGPSNIMSGEAIIIDEYTAVYLEDDYSVGFIWNDEENMNVIAEGTYTGMEAGSMEDILNHTYIRPLEFN